MSKEIYLDHASSALLTAPIENFLIDLYKMKLGNPASLHRAGTRAAVELEKARQNIAKKLGADTSHLFFTSGATEANNYVFSSVLKNAPERRTDVLVCATDHSSVVNAARGFVKAPFNLIVLPVLKDGLLDFEFFEKHLSEKTLLVSVAHANNEIGVIQDIKRIASLCKKHGALFHADGAQAFCKTPVSFNETGIDFYSMSAHKIHGPRGVGALAINKTLTTSPLYFGGTQENSFRPGTVPAELCAAFGKAAELYDSGKMQTLRDQMIEKLKTLPGVSFNGSLTSRLCNNINFSVRNKDGKILMQLLDAKGIRVSTGSACNSGKTTPSHVLMALGLNETEANSALRISLGVQTTQEEVDFFLDTMASLIQ